MKLILVYIYSFNILNKIITKVSTETKPKVSVTAEPFPYQHSPMNPATDESATKPTIGLPSSIPLLTIKNTEEFMDLVKQFLACAGTHVYNTLNDPNYVEEAEPAFGDMLKLPGVPAHTYPYATRDATTGVLSIKTDLASLESLGKKIEAFRIRRDLQIASEGPIVRAILARVSKESHDLMRSYAGDTYIQSIRRLGTTWKLIEESHLKPDTATMMEVIRDLANVSMVKGDYYGYLDKINTMNKSFNTVFKHYLTEPLSTFSDLLFALTLISGIDKSDQTFDTAIVSLREKSFDTPPASPFLPETIKLLTKAMHSRTLLDDRSNTNLHGLSSTLSLTTDQIAQKSVNEANSTLSQNVVDKCKATGCAAIIPYAVDSQGKHVPRFCGKCFQEHRASNRKAGLLQFRRTPTQTAPTGKPKVTLPVIPKKSDNVPKPATAPTFSGKNPILTAAAAEGESDDCDSDATY